MTDREKLPDPVDLPEGTRAIVKIQRPPRNCGENLSWMLYSEGPAHVRLYKASKLPAWVISSVGLRRKGYFDAEVSGGEWKIISAAEDQLW